MAETTNRRRQHGEDRYTQKLRFYDGIRVLPNNISRANSAVIWIAAIHTACLSTLAVARAQWFAFVTLFAGLGLCLLAVWPGKNAKPKQKEFNGTSPP